MENFALEASAHCAVVMIALHGGPEANGAVQRHLEDNEIPFTGPDWRAAGVAGNQVGLIHFLESWNAIDDDTQHESEEITWTIAHLYLTYACS